MTYELIFLPSALKEWRKLDPRNRDVFKKKLAVRLENPKIPSASLHGMKDCFKIKLRDAGFRLIYSVNDKIVTVTVISVGRRDGDVYAIALERLRDLGFRT